MISCNVCVRASSDYGYDYGWLVTEGDYADGGNDECFTMMMTIITNVALVLLPSVSD